MRRAAILVLLLAVTGCGPKDQAHDANGAACATRPIQIQPVNYQQGPNGYDYVYTTAILDADCKPIFSPLSMRIDILGHYTDRKTELTKEFWNVPFKYVDSPHSEIAPHIPKSYHSVLGDTVVDMKADLIDALDAEFLECILFRDGQPVANDVRAVGRAIKVIRPGETIVECHLAGELD